MIASSILSVIMASWSGTYSFTAPTTGINGIPLIEETVNVSEPGLPMYPVKTLFIPVPEGVEPTLEYSAAGINTISTSAVSSDFPEIPRAGVLVGNGLDAVEVPAEPVDFIPETAVLRGVYPLAGTQVAVVDIYPYTENLTASTVSISLDWQGGTRGTPIPGNHLLGTIAEGNVYWPDNPVRAESPFWGKPWARIAIDESGGYRITCSELEDAGCSVSGSPVASIAMFSGPGLQFADEPETEHSLEPVAILVDDVNGDGVFNNNDELKFLAGSLNRFEYREGALQWLYHRYATERIYWLTWGGESGARMEQLPGAPDGSPQWSGALDYKVHLEDGGYWQPRWELRTGWFWHRIGTGEQLSIPLNLGYAAGPADVLLVFAVSEPETYQITLQGYGTRELSGTGPRELLFEDVDVAGMSQLVISFSSPEPVADLYFDYVEFSLPVAQQASNRRIFFSGEPSRYNFTFSNGDSAFDLSDPMNPARITGGVSSSGTLSFAHTVGDSVSIMVMAEDQWLTPEGIEQAAPGRLVGTVTTGDRLLVVPPEFTDDALSLQGLLEGMGYVVIAATTQEIYDEFGQGIKDPGAIRSAVRWGMDSWTTPLSTVVLCGDATYDPLGYATSIPDLVPARIFLRNDTSYPAWAVEDWFSQVHENSVYPEIPVARIPAGNAAAFGAVCAKSVFYHSGEAGGSWCNRFVLFADDEWGGYSPSEDEHTVYMDNMCYSYLPAHAKPEKFYLIEYPWPPGTTPESIHPEKPEAREAFKDLWNQGMAVMLFFGHGSANQIAHEKVMLGDDPATLENGSRLPLAMFLSCDLSRFFVPGVDAIGEKVVYHPGGGAIASIGATGGTTAPANFSYASAMVPLMSSGSNSMSYAFWAGKLEAARAGNSSYYVYLGCPDLVLPLADEVMDVQLAGDTLRSGEVNTVQGLAQSSQGLALLEISESDIPWQYVMLNGRSINYYRQGGTAWRGRSPIVDGEFTADCVIPLASSQGERARIDVAAVTLSGVEIGADAPLPLVEGNPLPDTEGPEIDMWIQGQEGSEEPMITGEAVLEAELSDPSGITFLGRVGSSIRLFVDDTEYDLSDAFSYNTGSTETGQLQYLVSGLAAGQHRFILRVLDGVGNLSTDTLYVTSTDADEVAIQQHIVFPNPGSGTRCFSFNLSSTANVTVSIFTSAGRCIRKLWKLCPQGYNQIIWDGLDEDGDIPASGAYIYMIEAQTENGLFSQSSSVTGVLATVN